MLTGLEMTFNMTRFPEACFLAVNSAENKPNHMKNRHNM